MQIVPLICNLAPIWRYGLASSRTDHENSKLLGLWVSVMINKSTCTATCCSMSSWETPRRCCCTSSTGKPTYDRSTTASSTWHSMLCSKYCCRKSASTLSPSSWWPAFDKWCHSSPASCLWHWNFDEWHTPMVPGTTFCLPFLPCSRCWLQLMSPTCHYCRWIVLLWTVMRYLYLP